MYYVVYSQFFHQHVSAGIATIFRLTLLQEYKGANVVNCFLCSCDRAS